MHVLFVCVGNTGRSVMAERLLRRATAGRHEARSAGSDPGSAPDPVVLQALAEVGIDARDHEPRKLDDELVSWADVVISACDGACPVVPGKRYENWGLPDPHGRPLEEVRTIRDEIAGRVERLRASL
jgi:arsenate reductase (thioredoxin)